MTTEQLEMVDVTPPISDYVEEEKIEGKKLWNNG